MSTRSKVVYGLVCPAVLIGGGLITSFLAGGLAMVMADELDEGSSELITTLSHTVGKLGVLLVLGGLALGVLSCVQGCSGQEEGKADAK